MSTKNCEGTVDLFGEDNAGKLMGQRNASEREEKVCAVVGRFRPAICRTYGKHESLCSGIAKSLDGPGKFF
jgi:hypothetical protein